MPHILGFVSPNQPTEVWMENECDELDLWQESPLLFQQQAKREHVDQPLRRPARIIRLRLCNTLIQAP